MTLAIESLWVDDEGARLKAHKTTKRQEIKQAECKASSQPGVPRSTSLQTPRQGRA